jgi:hypothetical protein
MKLPTMADAKTTLVPFDGKPTSDFMIWELRIIAALKCKGPLHCVDKTYSVSGSPPTRPPNELESEKASILIVEALGDRPLRIVSNLTEDPRAMLNKHFVNAMHLHPYRTFDFGA